MFKNIFNFISQNIVLYLFRKINVGNITFHVIDTDQRYVFGDIDSKLKSEIIVNDRSFFQDLLFRQGIGFAESYMDGKWESESLYNSLDILAKNPQLSINKRLSNLKEREVIVGGKRKRKKSCEHLNILLDDN